MKASIEISERTRGYRGMVKRVPIGPCAFITPFNFPLNPVAHKVAPAIAAGCPFVMPYGGVKDSSFGREGLRDAIEDMTEPRRLVIRDA